MQQQADASRFRFLYVDARNIEWEVLVLSVTGHVAECDYEHFRSQWIPSGHDQLFRANVIFKNIAEREEILNSATSFAQDCKVIVVATDNDKHGEKIGSDVVDRMKVKMGAFAAARVKVKRARIKDLSDRGIQQAIENMEEGFDQRLVDSADVESISNFRPGE